VQTLTSLRPPLGALRLVRESPKGDISTSQKADIGTQLPGIRVVEGALCNANDPTTVTARATTGSISRVLNICVRCRTYP
jgi:hypothetical protein